MSNILSSIRTILVGVGGRGRWMVSHGTQDSRFDVVGLVDKCELALAEAGRVAGLSSHSWYSCLSTALASTGAEAVVISSPTLTHSNLCRIAFQHGAHVLVEKAMTRGYQEASELVDIATAAGVKFCVFQNFRYNPEFLQMRKVLAKASEQGHPGKIGIVDLTHHRHRPEPRTLTFPHAMVWDFAVHHIDLLISMLGPVEEVLAETFRTPWSNYPHDANIEARLIFSSGCRGTYLLTHDGQFRDMRMSLQGEMGSLHYSGFSSINRKTLLALPIGANCGDGTEIPFDSDRSSSEVVIDVFMNYLHGGVEPEISGRNNLEVIRTAEMLCLSSAQKRPIHRNDVN
jgi:predicted dehydrogenase